MNENYHPKRGERFTAFVTKTKAEDGQSCNIKTRNGPYWCCKQHTANSGRFLVSIAAVDNAAAYREYLKTKKGITFVFPIPLFRFEKI